MISVLLACTIAFQKGPPTTPIESPPKHKKPANQKPAKVKEKPTAPPVVPQYVDKPTGYGDPVKDGDIVVIQFLVKKHGGETVADSKKRGLPYSMKIGEAGNDPLLDMVVKGMKVGAVRTGTVKAKDAYGPAGAPPIVSAADLLDITITLLRRGNK